MRLCLLLGLLAVPVLSPVSAGGDGPLAPTLNGDRYDDLAIGHPYEDVWHTSMQNNAGAASVVYGTNGGLTVPGSQTWHQGWTSENPPGYDNLFGSALAIGDFDGDTFNDLAVGIPGEDIDGKNRAGAVHVFYGSGDGLTTSGDQFWHQNSPNVAGQARDHNAFGRALAAADFDGDGRGDLAIGVPGDDFLGGAQDCGAVQVLYGSRSGLASARNQIWYQGTLFGLADAIEEDDRFGESLAVGDFDRDGYADLAIGVPYEDLERAVTIPDAGVVHILYGSGDGLTAARDQLWNQDVLGLSVDRAQDGDRFGFSLVGGDFDGNKHTDLAVGVPGEAVGGPEAGAINVIYGGVGGLGGFAQFWTQDILPSAPGGADAYDQFGYALAAGDFNSDGRGDLAVGVPYERVSAVAGAGAVGIIYGSGGGLSTATGDQHFTQALSAIQGSPEENDNFGRALAAGDFNDNGAVDLAIGVPLEDEDGTGTRNTGVVHVLYGWPGHRLSAALSQTWDEGDLATSGVPQEGDQFGYALAASPPPAPHGANAVYVPGVMRNFNPHAAISDRSLKENFAPVDAQQVLAQVSEMPISTWNYTFESPAVRHIGPMAQDFYAAFGVGEDERHIFPLDGSGVSLAAIQGLHELVREKDARIASQERQVAELEARVAALEATVREQGAWTPGWSGWLLAGGGLLAGLGWVVWQGRRRD